MTRRLLVVWDVVAFRSGHKHQAAGRVPFAISGFHLGLKSVLALGRKVLQSLHVRAAFLKPRQVFFDQERGGPLGYLGRCERRVEAVIVTRRQRIKLVVVAFRAAERHRQECLTDAVHQIVQISLPSNVLGDHRGAPRPHPQEADRDQHLGVIWSEFISRDLFADELIVRLVSVERTDDVVAVSPRIRTLVIVRITRRVRIASYVQPMLPPALAIPRTFEQAIHQTLPCLR